MNTRFRSWQRRWQNCLGLAEWWESAATASCKDWVITEMWLLASGGMTPMEALHCATVNGAKIVGRPEELGTLEPGKLADLVIFDKNPLEDIHNTNTIRWVMKNGELFEGDTRDQVWPEQKKLAPLFFWNFDKPKEGAPLSYGKTSQP